MTSSSAKQMPASASMPAGSDVGQAKALAPTVNANLVSKGRDRYDRALLRKFQTAAGIPSDGIYGGGARGALIFYGVKNPPQPFFKPTATQPYPWTPTIAANIQAQKPAAPSAAPAARPAAAPSASKPAAKPANAKPKPIQTKPAAKPAASVAASTVASGQPPAGFDVIAAQELAPKVAADLVKGGPKGYSHALLKQFQRLAGIAQDGLYGGGARGALIFYGVKNPPQPYFKPTKTTPYVWTAYIAAALGKSVRAPKPKPGGRPSAPTPKPPAGGSASASGPVSGAGAAPGGSSGQVNVDPFDVPDQSPDFTPVPAAGAADSGTGQVATNADSDASAGAPESATGGAGTVALVALGGLAAYFGYKALKNRRKVHHAY